jgi:hypothetical protein
LKLFRFADRCHPAGTFTTFADVLAWLTEQTPAAEPATRRTSPGV